MAVFKDFKINFPPRFEMKLTPGQLEIRNEVKVFCSSLPAGHHLDTRQLVNQLRKNSLENQTIVNDELLSQNISNPIFSEDTFQYLSEYSDFKEINGPISINRPFYFVYSRGDELGDGATLISGGKKFETMFECLMSLNLNQTISETGWDLIYYENEGLLAILGGGNHRTLACCIFGSYNFNTRHCKVGTTSSLPLSVFDFETMVRFYNTFATGLKLQVEKNAGEVVSAMALARKVDDKFVKIYPDFIAQFENYRDYSFRPRKYSEIKKHFDEYYAWTGLSWWGRKKRCILNSNELSDFEKFLSLNI